MLCSVITINDSKQPPNWVKYVILISLIILAVGIYKGCMRFSKSDTQSIDVNGRIDGLVKDSIETKNKLQENKTHIEFLDGQLALFNNKNDLYLDSFRLLNDHIIALKKRYKSVRPSEDTTVTVVPNEYIVDCADCFASIDKAQQLGIRYKSQLDNSVSLNNSKVNLLNDRISLLEKQNTQLGKSYRGLLDSTAKLAPSLRRTLFVTGGLMSINQVFPNAIGGGFLYEDKKRRVFGAKYYISKYGTVYQAEFSLPLSLKIK